MQVKIITGMYHSYRGWNYSACKGYDNNDLRLTIMPGVQLDPIHTEHLTVAERGKLMTDLMHKRELNTHHVRVVATETVLFFFKAVPWDNVRAEAAKYIDENLGWFDLDKFNSGKIITK